LAAFLGVGIVGFLAGGAAAVQPDERLNDPVLEARARAISKDLRCLVCQNQSIDDSDAGLARDLRLLVRERLRAGDSDRKVIDYIVGRYGEFVLLKPRFRPATYGLWLTPMVVLLLAAFAAWRFLHHRRAGASLSGAGEGQREGRGAPLSDDERRRLDALFDDDEDTSR
jgi:cytochrome c-type biogenesis protein CcmH